MRTSPKDVKNCGTSSEVEDERLLEDLHDLAIVAERRNEETISFEEMIRSLQNPSGPSD
jgi:hypothetical protein